MRDGADKAAQKMKECAMRRFGNLDFLDSPIPRTAVNGWQYLARTAIQELRDNPSEKMRAACEKYLLANEPPGTDQAELDQKHNTAIWYILSAALCE